jgi:fumarate reductase flavoprotein subunit
MMNTKAASNPKGLEADIVIIGGGGAGLAAAVAGTEKGAKIILLEKRQGLGGNSVFAEGLFAAESPAQKRMMVDARKDELFRTAMDYSHWKINPRIIRTFMDKSGDTIRWLEAKGLKFDWIPALYPNQVPLVWHCLKRGGAAIVEVLVKDCEALGVDLRCDTTVKKILVSKKGEVAGVFVETDGKELEIKAKAVVIATGGYGGNKELLKRYCPSYTGEAHCIGLPHMGDELLMAIEMGAATEGLGLLHLNGPRTLGSLHLSAVAQEPNTVWINKRGERFTDETVAFKFDRANTIDRQPGKISYTLFDEKIRQNIAVEGLIKGIGVLYVPQRSKLADLGKDLQLEADKGRVKISHAWEEIAQWIGTAPSVLQATIDEYNAFCDQGYDEIFDKDRRYLLPLRTPPYYAIQCHSTFLGTIDGIKVSHQMEVLDPEDRAIRGLYAAGNDTGGWEGDSYCGALSGTTFGFAINSGRIAGENAATYAAGK